MVQVEAGGRTERIRDPFDQAVDHRFALERMLAKQQGWNGREPLLGHAVLFPYKHVFFSSIRAFKGLESPVVILCELEDIDDMTQNQQLYVAISRARNHCVVVLPPAG